MDVFHYTDKDGWNAIRSQRDWCFKASQPRDPDRPKGAYFTTLSPTRELLRSLHKRIRIPKDKQEYVFWFVDSTDLVKLNEGRGRDRWILYSACDYLVEKDRQRYGDATNDLTGANDDRRD